MTHRDELDKLIAKMRFIGAQVAVRYDAEGRYDSFQVTGAKGIGPHWMSPLSFAERAREWLAQ